MTGSGVKILVVDDEPIELRIMVQVLRSAEEYQVFSAANAQEGLDIALRERPLLIISDYRMPGSNGFEFCAKVKRHPELANTMFIVCSAAGDVSSKIEGLNIGADDYLTKPVDFEEMLLRVKGLVRLRALQDELAEDKRQLQKLNVELQEDFNGIINLLMKVLSLRVPVAIARVEQTLQLCSWLCDRLNLDDSFKRTLSLAGRLKEIGKISLPDDLLRKPSPLYSVQEREQCETFPVLGQLLLADIPQLKDVATLIRHQNENYDATGYPDRLAETRIPLGSRILRAINEAEKLMEVFPGLPDIAREKLMDSIGTKLDPRIGLLVEEYVRVVADPTWNSGKRRVSLEELQEGMVIAGDLITGRGMMLLSKDSALTHSQIEHLASLSHFDPIIQEIYVYDAVM